MKLSVHAVPHQSFLAIGSEVPIDKKSSFPPGEAERACADSPWCIPIGILRTAADPPGAMRRLPFQGRLDTRAPIAPLKGELAARKG